MDSWDTALREMSRTQKDKYYTTPLTCGPSRSLFVGTETRRVGFRGWGQGSDGLFLSGDQVSVLGE